MAIEKLGVLGAGAMGAGIAQVGAQAGLQVVLVDLEQKFIDRGLKTITTNWEKAIAKARLTESDKNNYLSNITTSTSNMALKDCDLIIEAIIENIDIKKNIFKELAEICNSKTVIATNTSGFSITEIAVASGRPEKVVGMHFFNPVPAMRLVEVIPGAVTSEETISLAMEAGRKIGKEPVRAKDAPGYIVNRILEPYLNEALTAYQEGIGTVEDVDRAMKLGANMPIGPLALCDLVGLDVLLMVTEYFHEEFGEPKFRPPQILKQKVRAGHFGVKTGKGFYNYNN